MINRDQFVAGVISKWADAGLAPGDMEKAAAILASFLEHADAKGQDVVGLLKEGMDKTAIIDLLANALPLELIQSAAKGIFNKTTDIGEKLISGAITNAPAVALGAGAVGLGVPYALGRVSGNYFGDMTDQGNEAIKTLKDQELLRALRESASYARQRKNMYRQDEEEKA